VVRLKDPCGDLDKSIAEPFADRELFTKRRLAASLFRGGTQRLASLRRRTALTSRRIRPHASDEAHWLAALIYFII
jgi:hypothetical protein